MTKLIKTNGEIIEVSPKNKKAFSYNELKDYVGGMIEIVPLPSGKEFVINEEGKLIGLEKNEEATKIWKEEYPINKYPDNNDELIVGNALLVEKLSELG